MPSYCSTGWGCATTRVIDSLPNWSLPNFSSGCRVLSLRHILYNVSLRGRCHRIQSPRFPAPRTFKCPPSVNSICPVINFDVLTRPAILFLIYVVILPGMVEGCLSLFVFVCFPNFPTRCKFPYSCCGGFHPSWYSGSSPLVTFPDMTDLTRIRREKWPGIRDTKGANYRCSAERMSKCHAFCKTQR